jgi:hypothetical protein
MGSGVGRGRGDLGPSIDMGSGGIGFSIFMGGVETRVSLGMNRSKW